MLSNVRCLGSKSHVNWLKISTRVTKIKEGFVLKKYRGFSVVGGVQLDVKKAQRKIMEAYRNCRYHLQLQFQFPPLHILLQRTVRRGGGGGSGHFWHGLRQAAADSADEGGLGGDSTGPVPEHVQLVSGTETESWFTLKFTEQCILANFTSY